MNLAKAAAATASPAQDAIVSQRKLTHDNTRGAIVNVIVNIRRNVTTTQQLQPGSVLRRCQRRRTKSLVITGTSTEALLKRLW